MKKWLRIVSAILGWVPAGLMIGYVDPSLVRDVGVRGLYLPLVGMVGLGVGWSVWLKEKSATKSLVAASVVMGLLVGQLMRVLNPLIIGAGVALLFIYKK